MVQQPDDRIDYRGKPVTLYQFVSSRNSIIDTTLDPGEVFDGRLDDCERYNTVKISALAQAAGTLNVEFYTNRKATTPIQIKSFPVLAGLQFNQDIDVRWHHFKVKFTDTGGGGTLDLQTFVTYEKASGETGSSVTLADPEHFNGTVTAAPIYIPSTPGNAIHEVLIKNKHTNQTNEELYVSFDGGTKFFTLRKKDAIESTENGSLKQIVIKGSSATVDYEIIMKRAQ